MPKRLFDVAFAALALILVSPLLLVLACWIKLDSPGPVFFRQVRVGRRGAPFRIHKLRTMRTGPAVRRSTDNAGPVHLRTAGPAQGAASGPADTGSAGLFLTVGDDPRITRAGRWLRRTRLDELPQLLDVLRGRMSLVGPRPEVPRYVVHYPPDLRERALAVRPGITDPASLAHLDEADMLARSSDPERTYIEDILPIKLRHAADYAEHATLATDLQVLARTARAVWARRRPTPRSP